MTGPAPSGVLEVSVALIRRQGRLFLQRRDLKARHFAGCWELPGGKVEPGERPGDAMIRELQEELGWRPGHLEALPSLLHDYGGEAVLLHPFLCQGAGELRTDLPWGWFTCAQILHLKLPEATLKIIKKYGETLGTN